MLSTIKTSLPASLRLGCLRNERQQKKKRKASQFTPWLGQSQREQSGGEEGERHEGSGADGKALDNGGSGVAGGVESVPCHNVLRVSRRW